MLIKLLFSFLTKIYKLNTIHGQLFLKATKIIDLCYATHVAYMFVSFSVEFFRKVK